MAKTTQKGHCHLCGAVLTRTGTRAHLLKTHGREAGAQPCRLIRVEGTYNKDYWLYLGMPIIDITRYNRANIKEEYPMKKILAILITLTLLLTMSCALAEDVPAINWEDVNIEETGIEGNWYVLSDVAIQYWAPDIFENRDLTEDDDESVVGKLVLPDDSAAIYVQYITGYEGATMEDVIASIEESGGTEIERCTLNGLDAVSYSIPDVDAGYVVFVTESGNYVQFVFMPMSDEGFASVAQLVTASIMPED